MNDASKVRKHTGGCHCGAVRFEVVVDATSGSHCNCTICTKVNQLGAMSKPFASVNLDCLDDLDPATVKVVYWDGRHDNWEGGARSTPWPVATPG